MDIDIFESKIPTWEDYMKKMSLYKYVLSPLSGANCLTLRFYEILLLGCIPIVQVKPNTLETYKEEAAYDCIFFQDIEEIPEKLSKNTKECSNNKPWLEDFIINILKNDLKYEGFN